MARTQTRIEEVTEDAEPAPPPVSSGVILPTEKRKPSSDLESRVALLYGPPKIGKSTFVSQMDRVLFIATEPGLEDLEVYDIPCGDWITFLKICAAVADSPEQYDVVAIDTIDMLSLYCSHYTNAKMGVIHESDLEWGKGWAVKRDEFARALSKLASLPLGLWMISHSNMVEHKTKTRTVNRAVPNLPKNAREAILAMCDMILYCDVEEVEDKDGEIHENRVLRTKPSVFWEAGERGNPPRLPETVPLNYAAFREEWYANDQ